MIGELLEAFGELGSPDFGDRAVFLAMVCAFLAWPVAFVIDVLKGWW